MKTEPIYAQPVFDQRAINIQRDIDRCARAMQEAARSRDARKDRR